MTNIISWLPVYLRGRIWLQ